MAVVRLGVLLHLFPNLLEALNVSAKLRQVYPADLLRDLRPADVHHRGWDIMNDVHACQGRMCVEIDISNGELGTASHKAF